MTHDEQQTRLRTTQQRGTRLHDPDEQPTSLRATKARQGEASGRIRNVLIISAVSAFAAMLLAWWYYFG